MITNYTLRLNPTPRTRNDDLLRPTFQNVSASDKKMFAIDRFLFTFAIMRPVSCDFCTVKSFAYFDTHFGMSICSTVLSLSLACPVHLSIRSLQNFDVTLQWRNEMMMTMIIMMISLISDDSRLRIECQIKLKQNYCMGIVTFLCSVIFWNAVTEYATHNCIVADDKIFTFHPLSSNVGAAFKSSNTWFIKLFNCWYMHDVWLYELTNSHFSIFRFAFFVLVIVIVTLPFIMPRP